jgi:sugar lactone lactonase YvrE
MILPLLVWSARAPAQKAVFSYAQRAVAKAELRGPRGVAVDNLGNVYIADTDNNRVLKEILRPDAGYTRVVVVNSGLSAPQGVAVDGNGNIYIADTGNNRVLKESVSGSAYTQSVVASTGLRAPQGIAVDRAGSVYIADTGNKRVLKETLSSTSTYVQSVVLANGLSAPTGVAVDSNLTVYIADAGTNEVLRERPYHNCFVPLASTGTGQNGSDGEAEVGGGILFPLPPPPCPVSYFQSVVTNTGLNAPRGVAVHETGTVYVADTGNNRILEEKVSGLAYTESVFAKLGLNSPDGVAARGHSVYVADTANNQVLNLDPPANFGSIAVGTTSAAQRLVFTFSFNFTSLGSTPYAVVTQGIAGLDFKAAATQPATACVTNHTYNAGNTCTVDVTFSPTVAGARYGAVTLIGTGNTVIATAYAVGVGTSPQVTLLPLIQSTVAATGFSNPADVAVDAKGNVYVVDGTASTVLKETLQGNGTYTQSTIPNISGLINPLGIAVDGTGTLYVADTNNARVMSYILQPNGSYSQNPVATGLTKPQEVAVDGGGNVYSAQFTNPGTVLKWTLQTNGSYVQSTVASGLAQPAGIAVDESGNVYVGETIGATQRVLKETLQGNGTYVQSVIASGVNQAFCVTVDGIGNVYYTDKSNNVWELTLQSNGTYIQSLFKSGLSAPSGVAFDGNGNIYISETGTKDVLKFGVSTAKTLNFAKTSVGATSSDSPQTVSFENFGNVALTLPIPGTGNNPSIAPTSFTLDSSGGTACPLVSSGSTTAGTLAANTTCTLPISFSPTVSGTITGQLVLTDNNLNVASPYATQIVTLNGSAVGITISPSTLPNGTLGTAYPTQTLTASGGTTAPYTFAVTTGSLPPGLSLSTAGVISGTPTAAGTYTFTITATDSTPAASGGPFTGSANYSVTVPKIASAVTVASNNNPSTYGTSVTFTATVPSGTIGTITFNDNGTAISGAVSISGTTAAFTTSTLGAGTHPITAVYSGDANHAGSTSPSLSQVVNRAVLTVSIANILRALDTPNPTLADVITGFVNGDTSSVISGTVTLTTTATTRSRPGTYPITFSSEGLTATNYTFNYVAGTLTILRRSRTTISSASATNATIDVFGYGFAPPSGTLTFTDTTTSTQVAAPATLDTTTAYTWLLPMAATSTGASTSPTWTELGDLDGDGIPDLVTSLYLAGSVSVQLANGDGTFGAATVIPIATGFGTAESHLFSLRGNGVLDLVVASFSVNEIAVLLGNGNGTFQSPVFYTVGSSSSAPYSLTAGDFNHDGKLDIAVSNNGDNTVSILLGNGSGALAVFGSPIPVGHDPQAIRAGDFNGDGYSDLAVANYGDGTVTTLLNNQSGGFAASTLSVGSGAQSGPQALAITGTGGGLKLAVANYRDNTIGVMNSNGNGTFGAQTIVAVGQGPDDVQFANFNGVENLVVTNYIDGTLDLLVAGSGSYTLVGPFQVGPNPYSAAVGDIDLDDTPDFVVANSLSNSTGVLLSGTQISVPYSGLSLVSGNSIQATYTRNTSGAYVSSTSPGITAP